MCIVTKMLLESFFCRKLNVVVVSEYENCKTVKLHFQGIETHAILSSPISSQILENNKTII